MLTNPVVGLFKTPKTSLSESETVTTTQISCGTSYCKFGKHLRAKPFLVYKQNSMSQIFTSGDYGAASVTLEELRKKYFGRKVIHISRSRQTFVLIRYAKYLRNVSWKETNSTRNVLPRQRNLRTRNSSKQNYIIARPIGGFVTINQDLAISQKNVLRLILASYPKITINLSNCLIPTLIKWKSMLPYTKKLIKHVNLEFLSSDSISQKKENLFVGFDNLASFSLHGNQAYPLLDFFPKLVQIKTLQYIYLNLESALFWHLSFADLCAQIEAHNIPKWHIRVRATFDDISHNKHDFIFSQIDCLGLGKVYAKGPFGGAGDFHYYGYPVHTTSSFFETKYLHENRKKVLELAIVELTKFDIGQLLVRCKSLEGLYIRLNAYDYPIIYNPPSDVQPRSWASKLKDVVFSFTQSSNPDSTFNSLVSIVKSECPQLETLQLFSCHNTINDVVDEEGFLSTRKNSFIIDAPDLIGIEKLTSLRYLRLATIQDLGSVVPLLSYLPNLKTLELSLGEKEVFEKMDPWDRNLLFSSFEGLQELRIDKIFMSSQECGKGLLENLQYLQNLQVFEFKESTEDVMSLEMLKKLIEGFYYLGKMKKLVLNVSVRGTLESEKILEEIKALITRYIESHKHLEELDIKNLKGLGVNKIKYKKS